MGRSTYRTARSCRAGIVHADYERGGRLYEGTRVDFIWTVEDEAAFLKDAPAHLHLPLLLALWTWTTARRSACPAVVGL